jgi:hypothetical protein
MMYHHAGSTSKKKYLITSASFPECSPLLKFLAETKPSSAQSLVSGLVPTRLKRKAALRHFHSQPLPQDPEMNEGLRARSKRGSGSWGAGAF